MELTSPDDFEHSTGRTEVRYECGHCFRDFAVQHADLQKHCPFCRSTQIGPLGSQATRPGNGKNK